MGTPLNYASPRARSGDSWWWELAAYGLFLAVIPHIVPRFVSSPGQVPAAQADVRDIRLALDNFKLDTGRYPAAAEGLGALLNPPTGLSGWQGPYDDVRRLSCDPWGRPYVYVPPTTSAPPKVLSLGPDGTPGTDDVASR